MIDVDKRVNYWLGSLLAMIALPQILAKPPAAWIVIIAAEQLR